MGQIWVMGRCMECLPFFSCFVFSLQEEPALNRYCIPLYISHNSKDIERKIILRLGDAIIE